MARMGLGGKAWQSGLVCARKGMVWTGRAWIGRSGQDLLGQAGQVVEWQAWLVSATTGGDGQEVLGLVCTGSEGQAGLVVARNEAERQGRHGRRAN